MTIATACEPAASLTIEFSGPPGVGKSTIAHALDERRRSAGAPVSEPTWERARAPGSMGVRQLRCAVWLAFADPITAARLLRVRATPRQALDLLYGAALVRRHATRDGIHLFDQGPLQSIASIAHGVGPTFEPDALQATLLRVYATSPQVVFVLVQADAETIVDRLRGRPGAESGIERLGSPEATADAVRRYVETTAPQAARLAERLAARSGGRLRVMRVANGASDTVETAVDAIEAELRGATRATEGR